MAAQDDTGAAREMVWRPSSRAFFVYYVAFAVVVFGPLINPEAGLPPWLGLVAGILVLGAIILGRFGREYRATPRGLKQVGFWPAKEEEIPWPDVGKITMQRGLVQTLLNVGNVVIHDKPGTRRLTWERLANPQGVVAALEARRAASGQG